MDGVRQLFSIDKEADLLPVYVIGQGCVGMAGEAILVLEFVVGASGENPAEQNKERSKKSLLEVFTLKANAPAG